ncbi:MAG: TatD family hydrolase [Candidatus Saccharibacteria bacterium]|nr:TatD family hydrolase [Candidatus Saccharibacteria bacterium]
MLIDSHCHLHDREFFTEEQAKAALENATKNGVEKTICIGTSADDSIAARDYAEDKANVYWTYGVHPSEWKKWQETSCDKEVNRGKFHHGLKAPVAIGEVGLDYHYGKDDHEEQKKLFIEMLELAKIHHLPVVFHVREAFDDFFEIVKNYPEIKGVVHSFSDSKKVLKRILDETDYYIGVNGLATYSTLPTPPLERILLETDAPFLAPVPHKGETNEPAYIKDIAKWLSEKLGVDVETVAKVTTKNVEDLFKLS